jgi:hypothetical protein
MRISARKFLRKAFWRFRRDRALLASVVRRPFWDGDSGASDLKFTIGMVTHFVILLGISAFNHILHQRNAVRFGALLAAVSEPASSDLASMTGISGSVKPGDAMPIFDRVCTGSNATGLTGTCTNGGTYRAAASRLMRAASVPTMATTVTGGDLNAAGS